LKALTLITSSTGRERKLENNVLARKRERNQCSGVEREINVILCNSLLCHFSGSTHRLFSL
jgi:hypothetical protein